MADNSENLRYDLDQVEEVGPDLVDPNSLTLDLNAPAELNTDHDNGSKIFIIVVIVIVFFLLVAGILYFFFSQQNKPNGNKLKPTSTTNIQPIKLKYWGLWDDKAVFDGLIAEYRMKNPNVEIEYIKMDATNGYKEQLINQILDGAGPDIFRFHNTWLTQLKEIVDNAPDDLYPAGEYSKTFYPVVSKDLTVDGVIYGIPLYIDGLVLIYNEIMLKEAGLSPPKTWDELIKTHLDKLRKLDKDNNLLQAPIAIGTAENIEHFSDIFNLILLQNGTSLTSPDVKIAANTLETYRKFAEGTSTKQYWNETMPNSIDAFIQGKVAMIFAPSWQVMVIKTINPDLKIKTAPVPQGSGKQVSIASYWAEGVSKLSKNQQAAWDFLKYLASKDSQTKFYEAQVKLRMMGTVSARLDMANILKNHEYLGAVVEQAPYYDSSIATSRTHDGPTGINESSITYLRNAINGTIQGLSYDEAMQVAIQGIKQINNSFIKK